MNGSGYTTARASLNLTPYIDHLLYHDSSTRWECSRRGRNI